MKFLIAVVVFCLVPFITCFDIDDRHQISLNRLVRGVNKKGHQSECRYEKEAWQDCDPNTGQQRRVLKLKSSRSVGTNCEQEKYIQRPCKKNCRYSKGLWTECVEGSKHRTDTIKAGSGPSCEATRNVTKACKEQCNYQKSDWSVCENGVKTKTLTLQNESGVRSGCEPTKLIRKQCGHRQNRKDRTKSKKGNAGHAATDPNPQ